MKNWRLLNLFTALLLAVSVFACGDDDDNDTNGNGNGGNGDAAAPADDAAADAAVAEDAGPVVPEAVAVKLGDKSAEVKLADLPKAKINGTSVVLISAIIDEAGLDVDIPTTMMDFEGSDNYRASVDNPKCADVLPVAADNADKVGVDLANDNTLVWDESLGIAKCANVKYLATIYLISTVLDLSGVDYGDYDTAELNGTDVVLISTLFEQLAPDTDLDAVMLDFEGSDGFRPSSKDNCADFLPIDGANAGKVGVDPADDNTLVWDSSLDAPGCAAVKDVARIHIKNK